MKKILFASIVCVAIASCSSSGNKTGGDTDSGYKDIRGVENPNGNIPDTTATGATPHSDKPPVDSSRVKPMDSSKSHNR